MSDTPFGNVARLAQQLAQEGVDAFIGFHSKTLQYLCNFDEDAHERFLALVVAPSGQLTLICPALSESQARRMGIEDIRAWADGEDPLVLFEQLADELNLKSGIIALDPTVPARQLLPMQNALPAALYRDGEYLISSLMRCKAEEELEKMRQAAKIADDAYEAILPQLKAGLTERQIEKMVNDAMAERGGEPTFCIIAAAGNAAEPHHASDDTVVQSGDVLLLDFGCNVAGYQSDITRTVAIGSASEEAKASYRLVYAAHMAGVKAVRPGIPAKTIDQATRGVIEAAGEGAAFFHRTGHGIGLNGHEHPYITATNEEILEPGNCFSVEPGVYYRDQYGIRLETIVAVTANGCENLNAPISPELVVVG